MQISINSFTLQCYQCGGVACFLICLIAVSVDIYLGQIRSLTRLNFLVCCHNICNSEQSPKKDIKKKTNKMGPYWMEHTFTCMIWIDIKSLVIILRFIIIRATFLQFIILHYHYSTGALFYRDPYFPRQWQHGITSIYVSFTNNICLHNRRFPPNGVCISHVIRLEKSIQLLTIPLNQFP